MAGDKYDTICQELVNLQRVSLQTVFRLYIKTSENTHWKFLNSFSGNKTFLNPLIILLIKGLV